MAKTSNGNKSNPFSEQTPNKPPVAPPPKKPVK